MRNPDLENAILNISDDKFNDLAGKIFQLQAENCRPYQQWIRLWKGSDYKAAKAQEYPFLPVGFFKTHRISSVAQEGIYFESSTTTGGVPSKHSVPFPDFYARTAISTFEKVYGNIRQYQFLALLPSYLERGNASLVYMVQQFTEASGNPGGFFLNDTESLKNRLVQSPETSLKTVLLGVTYALLDLAENWDSGPLKHIMVIETGGMKGRKQEITRTEVHEILKTQLGITDVHSEYGMTELMSQAWAAENGLFRTPPWMKILIRDISDPSSFLESGKTGQICVIDLANLYSCSFLATDDIGRMHSDGTFEVLGRLDFSEVRGCNLMVT